MPNDPAKSPVILKRDPTFGVVVGATTGVVCMPNDPAKSPITLKTVSTRVVLTHAHLPPQDSEPAAYASAAAGGGAGSSRRRRPFRVRLRLCQTSAPVGPKVYKGVCCA